MIAQIVYSGMILTNRGRKTLNMLTGPTTNASNTSTHTLLLNETEKTIAM